MFVNLSTASVDELVEQQLSSHLRFAFCQIDYSLWHVEAMMCTLDGHNPTDVRILEFDEVLQSNGTEMATGGFLSQR